MWYATMFAFLISMGVLFVGQPAACVYCPSYKCFGPCGQCMCLSGPGEVGGRCYGQNAVPVLRSEGYRELP